MNIDYLRQLIESHCQESNIKLEKFTDEQLSVVWHGLRKREMRVGEKFIKYEDVIQRSKDNFSSTNKSNLSKVVDWIIKQIQTNYTIGEKGTPNSVMTALNENISTDSVINQQITLNEDHIIITSAGTDNNLILEPNCAKIGSEKELEAIKSEEVIEKGKNDDDKETKSPDIQIPVDPNIKQSPVFKSLSGPKLRMRNARIGEFYSDKLELGFPEYEIDKEKVTIDGLYEIGLGFDKEFFSIQGVPKQTGEALNNYDHEFTVRFKPKTGEMSKVTVRISILPDPKTLWKELKSDPSDKYFKEDKASFFKRVKFPDQAQYHITAASIRGRSHAHNGTFRDDHFKVDFDEEKKWVLLIVSDGAGSAKFSRKGSEIACEETNKLIREKLKSKDYLSILDKLIEENDQEAIANLFHELISYNIYKVTEKINIEALDNQAQLKDYHATLLVTFIYHIDQSNSLIYTWSVGDGGICLLNMDEQKVDVLNTLDEGEYSGQTRFLTMNEIIETAELRRRARIVFCERTDMIVVMTDGITDPKFETSNNLSDFNHWRPVIEELNKEVLGRIDSDAALVDWCGFWSDGNHDDRTILIYHR